MKRKVWNLVVVIGLLVSACGIYFLAGDKIGESWAVMVTETDGGSNGTKSTQSACGSYYTYPRRCSEGYESNMVAYGGRTCYTACTKKTAPAGTSDFCANGNAFASLTAANSYCEGTGFSTATQSGTTTSGKICAICAKKAETCLSKYGEIDSKQKAVAECGGVKFVKISTRTINNEKKSCYSCKTVTETLKCTPVTTINCHDETSCLSVGGTWDGTKSRCQQGFNSYNEFCKSLGFYYVKQTCPEWYESYSVGGSSFSIYSGESYYNWNCYSECQPVEKFCGYYGLYDERQKCASGTESYRQDTPEAIHGCWTACTTSAAMICGKNDLTTYKPTCGTGEKSYAKIYDGQTCYTDCEASSEEVASCYLCNGSPSWGKYSSSAGCFPLSDVSATNCKNDPAKNAAQNADVWRTYIYGTTNPNQDIPAAQVRVTPKKGQIILTADSASAADWEILISSDPITPTTEDFEASHYVVLTKMADGTYGATYDLYNSTAYNGSGTYYVYGKDWEVALLDVVEVDIPNNNKISELIVSGGKDSSTGSSYQGNALEGDTLDESSETVDSYVIKENETLTYPSNKNKVVMLSARTNNNIATKKLGSTEDKTLTVDPDTGLLLYTLNDSEKASLGITDEKVYVVSSKQATKVIRNEDGTFTENASGDIIAASTGEKGTIYKVSPKNDITFMKEYSFYAIVLDYIKDASYSDSNSWNDLKLLSYGDTPTIIDTDFIFTVTRKGWDGKVTKLSATNQDVKIMPLASAINEDLGKFYIDFESGVTQYEFSVNSDQVTLNPVLVYTDSEYVEGYGPRTVDLDYGVNVEYIKVKSADGKVRTYTLLITRIDNRSSDNTLKSLTVRNVKLTPSFAKYTNTYYGTVENNVTKVEIAAEKNNGDASFVSGYGSRTENLKVGKNTILVKVTSETGSERVYTLVITRKGTPEVVNVDKTKSANNNLELLLVSSVSFMFDTDVTNYNLYVSNSITSVLVTATAEDEKATVATTGGTNLQVGTNKVTVVVTAENGTTKTYTINIIRKEEGLAVSTDSTLSDLQIGSKNIHFSPTNYLYNVTVFPGVEELSLSLTPSSAKAQIEVIGNQELSDYTTVKVKVIAEDGSYSIYDINVSVNNITKGEIAIFIVCSVLVVGLVVYGTISRNRKKKELNI